MADKIFAKAGTNRGQVDVDQAMHHDQGDGSFDEAVGGHMYVWSGSAWVKATASTVSGTVTWAAPTTLYNGKKTVTTAGTRVTLAGSTAVQAVTVKALKANTGTIYVGTNTVAASNGFQLAAGESVSLDLADLATVNLDCSVNGEGVTYIAVAA